MYDSLYNRWVDGEDCGDCRNSHGGLAWGESYLLGSLVEMWATTGDAEYARKFARRAEAVVGATDAVRGRLDWAGRSLQGWSATKYSHDGEPIVMAEHTGLLVIPLLRFVLTEGDRIVDGPLADREFVIGFVRAALEDVDKNYRFDPRTGRGNTAIEYGAPQGGGPPLLNRHDALNSDAVLGLSYLLLWLADEEPDMGARARAIALHVRDNLMISEEGVARWRYYCEEGQLYSDKWDDVDHGALLVDFVQAGAEAGVVFSQRHVEALGTTFLSMVGEQGIAKYVDGSGPAVTAEALCREGAGMGVGLGAVGRWIPLERTTPAVGPIIRRFNHEVLEACQGGDAGLLLAVARSIRGQRDAAVDRLSP